MRNEITIKLLAYFLPRDATQSAGMSSARLSVRLSVRDVEVGLCFSHSLEYIENNFTAE